MYFDYAKLEVLKASSTALAKVLNRDLQVYKSIITWNK